MKKILQPLALAFALLVPAAAAQAAPPVISGTSFSHVGTTSATFAASINPKGATTNYHFEYGTSPCSSSACAKIPFPKEGKVPASVTATGEIAAGNLLIENVAVTNTGVLAPGQAISGSGIEAGSTITAVDAGAHTITISKPATATKATTFTATGPQPVSAQPTGLTPGTTYRFRLVADNGETADGPELTFATYADSPLFPPCPNDEFRTGALSPPSHPSALLPDCRAYEQVSPVEKNGGQVDGVFAASKSSPDGNRVLFESHSNITGDNEGAQEWSRYLATRESVGWSTTGLFPSFGMADRANTAAWSPDLSLIFDSAADLDHIGGIGLVARDSDTGQFSPVFSGGGDFDLIGSSPDNNLFVFESPSALPAIPGSIKGHPNLYLWDRQAGSVSLVDRFNDGTVPSKGARGGPYDWAALGFALDSGRPYYTQEEHAVSDSGSVFFTDVSNGQLYERLNPTQPQSAVIHAGEPDEECTEAAKACTIHLSTSRKENGEGPNGTDAAGAAPAAFMAATPDGSTAYFTSSEKLTNDATTGPEPGPASIARAKVGPTEAEEPDHSFIPDSAVGLATEGEYIYWANPKLGSIGRAKLDGTEVKGNFITGLGSPRWLAADSKYLYWTDIHGGSEGEGSLVHKPEGTIGRIELSGAEPEPDFITGAFRPRGIAVSSEYIYWANEASSNFPNSVGLGRAKITGEGVNQEWLHTGNQTYPAGLVIDGNHLYFTTAETGFPPPQWILALNRIDLDGSNRISKVVGIGSNFKIGGIAVDGSHLYYADQTGNEIGRADLDLANIDPEYADAGESPIGLVQAEGHLYWTINGEIPFNAGNDLYRYKPASGSLEDLTVDNSAPNGAEVKGFLGASSDGKSAYFVANGVLAANSGPEGGFASPGNCSGFIGEFATYNGECNLYLTRGGETRFIARLNGAEDAMNWLPHSVPSNRQRTSRITPDGRFLLFSQDGKFLRYDSVAEALVCVTCNPTGEASSATLGGIPAPPSFAQPSHAGEPLLSRNLSPDGSRVFFDTPTRLVAADRNGEAGCPLAGGEHNPHPSCMDVYEWEAVGHGSCEESPGCLYLLSSGTSNQSSYFLDASSSGDDVFMVTASRFVGQDGDQLQDVYDAHVGGGLAAQNQTKPPPCEGEGCRPEATAAPAQATPATPAFQGPGNIQRKPPRKCPKGKVRRHGHCVKKKHSTHHKGQRR